MKKYDWNVEKLREIVKNCINFGEVLEALIYKDTKEK